MIKEIFLPEKTKTRRFISQRIIGVTIQEQSVNAAQVYATPSGTFVEKIHAEMIPPGAPGTEAERISSAIRSLLTKFSKHHQIRIAISSSIVTFKELTLPFTDLEKIRMVLDYEVEPMLPFSIAEAITDFIITHQDKKAGTSQILVAAVRAEQLQQTFDIFTNAGIDPTAITVDLFAAYGLYLQIPDYKKITDASAIIDMGTTTTSVSFLLDGQMRLIRNISRGLRTISEHISEDTQQPLEDVMQDLINYGAQKPDQPRYNQAAQKYLTTFFNDVQFTLNSFSLKLNFYKEINKILFFGRGAQIKELMEFGSTLIQIPCELFSCDKLFKTKQFKNKTKRLVSNWLQYTITLGTAITYQPHDAFDLRKKEFAKTDFPLLRKQLLVAGALIITLLATLVTRSFLQIRTLKSIVSTQTTTAITQLKKIFPPRDAARKKSDLRSLFRLAERKITEQEEAWKPFFQENLQPLEILKDLTGTINKDIFNINIERMSISLEDGIPTVDISGIFVSKTDKHFVDYNNFVKYFEKNSKLLTISDRDEEMADPVGVKFTFNLKVKAQNHDFE